MKIAAIMQPTYLPWLGYFDLMDRSDVFVILDSVQFERRSWQQRNQIKTKTGSHFLTVPVKSHGKFGQRIDEVLISQNQDFGDDHLKNIQFHYAKTPFFGHYYPELTSIIKKPHKLLIDLNLELIEWFRRSLNITTPMIRSSQLRVTGKKTQLLASICKILKADTYISPQGAKAYIVDTKIFTDQGIHLLFHQYCHPTYPQLFGEFIPYMSTLDLLFNAGTQSKRIIRSGRLD